MIKLLYHNNKNKIETVNVDSMEFRTKINLNSGCILRPLLISVVVEDATKRDNEKWKGMKLGYWKMSPCKN